MVAAAESKAADAVTIAPVANGGEGGGASEALPEVLPEFPDVDQDGDAVLASQSPTKSGTATSSTGLTETTVQQPPGKNPGKQQGTIMKKQCATCQGATWIKLATPNSAQAPKSIYNANRAEQSTKHKIIRASKEA